MCLANGVIAKGEGLPCPLDEEGRFIDPVTDFMGLYVKVRADRLRSAASSVLSAIFVDVLISCANQRTMNPLPATLTCFRCCC